MVGTLFMRLATVALIALLWGATFLGALSIAKLDLGHWSYLCGPWGCLPETAPLLSVHGMWLALVGGIAWLSRLAIPVLQVPAVWLAMLMAAIAATLVLLGIDGVNYWNAGGETVDIGRRAAYRLATWTDLPLIQIVVACAGNWLLSHRSCCTPQVKVAS